MDETISLTAGKPVSAVVQAVQILKALARNREPLGAAAIARETGISVSTCFNILRTLATERLIDFDDDAKVYRLGLGVLTFSAPLLGVNQTEIIRPELTRLAEQTDCLICLWTMTDSDRIVLADRISSEATVRIDARVGSRLPAFVGAVGRCVASHHRLPESELKRRFDGLKWQVAPSFEAYADSVRRARADGFALDDGNLFRGVTIAGAVITDARDTLRYGLSAIAIAGQVDRDGMQRVAVDLRDSADWISETLFGVPAGKRQLERRAADAPPPPPRRGQDT